MQDATYTAFAGVRRVAAGTLADVLPVLKRRFDRNRSEIVLVYDDATGRQVDFDLTGPLDEVLERALPTASRGPGRPRLGVTSREVSLLPRHWEWLEHQSSGTSGALRRLVERGIAHQPGRERARRIRAALSTVLTAMAGDRPNYEESTRAMFRGDVNGFEALVKRWPRDIRTYAVERARAADRAEREGADPASVVTALHERVWSRGEYAAIPELVAPEYVVHSDPGDPWEGRRLDHSAYRERVAHSRRAFPDLAFHVDDIVANHDRVAVRWHAEGTQSGDLPGLPATGKRLSFRGQTQYELRDARVAGHWQVVDRLGFLEQVRSRVSAPRPKKR